MRLAFSAQGRRSKGWESGWGSMVRAPDEVRRIRPDRVPPHNLEAEESVLGSMMLSPEAIAELYYQIHAQPRSAWTLEADLRPHGEKF